MCGDDTTLAATFGVLEEEIEIFNPLIPSKDLIYLSIKGNDSIENNAKQQSSTTNINNVRNSQLSTNNISNLTFGGDDDDDHDFQNNDEKQGENQIEQKSQLIYQWPPPEKPTQKANTERSRSRKSRKKKANNIPKNGLKNITLPYFCECGYYYDNAPAITNHIAYMQQQKDTIKHKKIPRYVCHGRPRQIKELEIQTLLQDYQISPSKPGDEDERTDRIITNLQKFYIKIIQKKIYYHIDLPRLEPLFKDLMRLRKLFGYLPNQNDAEKFNSNYIMDKLKELKIIEPNRTSWGYIVKG